MDHIIQQFDFLKATDDSEDAFRVKLDQWKKDNREGINKQMAVKSLDAAMVKVGIADFPGKDTAAGEAAETAFDSVLSVMRCVLHCVGCACGRMGW